MASKLWLPGVTKVPMEDAGVFTGGGHKIGLHTTEGPTIAGAEGAYRTNRSAPHLTFSIARGDYHQHIPFNRAARSLEHTLPEETNRANVIQIELVGYARESHDWSDKSLDRLAKVCKQIERMFDVPHRCGVDFGAYPDHLPARLSGQAFVDYAGYLGHQHVPGNSHGDPGAFRINYLLHGSPVFH